MFEKFPKKELNSRTLNTLSDAALTFFGNHYRPPKHSPDKEKKRSREVIRYRS